MNIVLHTLSRALAKAYGPTAPIPPPQTPDKPV